MSIRFPRSAAIVCFSLLSASLSAQPKTITVLHTNDMHAAFMPHEALWVKESPRPMVGGFAELFLTVDSIRKALPAVLILDAGDVMTGNPITERTYGGAFGGALIEMMNRIGYDAWSPGNHDFDISQDNLRALIRLAKFPTLSANLVDNKNGFPVGNRPYAIFERGGLKIGVIGLMSQELSSLVNQNNLTGVRVLSPRETLQKYIDEINPATDLVIALTHQGVEEDSLLATGVTGLDMIVGGHSHTRLRKPRMVNGVAIVQTGSSVESLGEVTLSVENGRIVSCDGKLHSLWSRPTRPSSPASVLADSMQAEIEKEFSEVIATLTEDWTRRDGQSSIGTFIADAQREAAAAEVGFMNNYGIRRDVPAGPLTKKTLFEVLPFRNILTTFQLSGKQLRDVMVHNIQKKATIQIAGMSGVWKRRPDGIVEFTSILVGGRPLEESRMYVCAASDYFVGEANRYLGLEVPNPIFLRQTVFDAVERIVRREKSLRATVRYEILEAH